MTGYTFKSIFLAVRIIKKDPEHSESVIKNININ